MCISFDIRSPGRPFVLAATFTLGIVVAACDADRAEPLSPTPGIPHLATVPDNRAFAMQLTGDAIVRLLPVLAKDAAAPLGNALRSLDATLRDPRATAAALDRAVRVLENTLAQFTDLARSDAADLDAVRLGAAEIRAELQQ